MCPMFRISRDEAATPRAKANLLRYLLGPAGDPKRLSSSEVRDVAELCINCKMCAHECSAHIHVPKMMLEAKAAHQAEHGLDRSDWVLARIESFAALGGNFALTTNTLLSSRVVALGLAKCLRNLAPSPAADLRPSKLPETGPSSRTLQQAPIAHCRSRLQLPEHPYHAGGLFRRYLRELSRSSYRGGNRGRASLPRH